MHVTKQEMDRLGRLKKRSDFLHIGKENKKWISKILILQNRNNSDIDDKDKNIRFGITVSKKVHKSAVKRNRIRRQIRAAAYDVFSNLSKENNDFVIIARNNILKSKYKDIVRDIKWCLKRMDLTKDND